MKWEDALFNWLQIKLVSEARPFDDAAKKTVEFFEQILREDHGITDFAIDHKDDTMIHVRYVKEGKVKKQFFDRTAAEKLLSDIESDWKYQ